MTIRIVAELPDSFNSSQFTAVTSASGNFYLTTTEPRVRGFNAVTLSQVVSSTTTPAASPSGIGIITNASAIVVSSTNSQYDFMNLFTGARGSITSNASPTKLSNNNQQVACNTASGIAVVTQTASGGFKLVNGNSFTVTSVTVSGMSNEAPTCVILRSPSSTFIIGSDTGVIREVTTSGAVLQMVSVPVTPAIAPYRQQSICGLAAVGKYVVAVTSKGMMYCFDWDNPANITDSMVVGMGAGASPTLSLSNSSSGVFIIPSGSTATSNNTLTEVYLNNGKFFVSDIFVEEIGTVTFGGHIDVQTNRLVRLLQSTSTQKGRLFEISPTNRVNVSTRIQYPLGTDVPGTILRIRDSGIGSAQVEVVSSIGATVVEIPATDGQGYIELAEYDNSGSLYWDIREFEA